MSENPLVRFFVGDGVPSEKADSPSKEGGDPSEEGTPPVGVVTEEGNSPAEVKIEAGTTVLEAAERAGVAIESLCGGDGLCGTCKVVVEDGAECLSSASDADDLLLSAEERTAGYRLSCRATVECGPIDVRIPTVSQVGGSVVLTEGTAVEFDLDPAVRNYHLELDPPTLADNTADLERVTAALEAAYGVDVEGIDPLVHRELPGAIRAGEIDDRLHVTVTVYDDREIIDVAPGPDGRPYGLAIDVGTTTLAAYLIDLRTGDRLAVGSRLNPQATYGADIMSRMRHVRRSENGRAELQEAIVGGVNDLVEEVIAEAGIDGEDVYEAVLVGNTAMHHLFLGIDPNYVAGSPYVPANHAPVAIKARELNVGINPAGYIYWLPVSGGWVGPDAVSVMLVSGHHDGEDVTVCVDVGTNGEISVGNGERTWTTSAPAGPALEGAEITHGVRARTGAIEHVGIDPETLEPDLAVVGDEPPIGICGSGMIDVLAELFEAGVIDRRGQFQEGLTDRSRIRRTEDDDLEYVLVFTEESGIDGDVVVTQADLREIQHAKAAIQAGTLVLLSELGVEEVDRVVVAGAFGTHVDPESAMTIGLFPDVGFDAVESLGNAAGIGAQLALVDREKRAKATDIVDAVEYFEIAGTETFRDNFMDSMYLPHRRIDRYPNVRKRLGTYDEERGVVRREGIRTRRTDERDRSEGERTRRE